MKGKVTQRGDSWSVIVDLPRDPATGERRRKRITAATKQEAERQAIQVLAEIASGGFAEADANKITVEQYLTRWLESVNQTMRPASARRYSDLMRLHVMPYIGRVRLGKLTALDVQTLYARRKAEAGLSSTTLSNIHVVLHRALKQAVRWKLLTYNVTEQVDPPRKLIPACKTWTQEQAAAFLGVADQDEWAALWRLALFTGMRRGELLALRWEEVDLTRKVLSVTSTLSRGRGGVYEFGQPKSAAGRRSIAISDSVVKSLQKHKARQAETRLRVGALYTDMGMVFATQEGKPVHPNSLALRFNRLIAQAKVPKIRFHDLRHTAATLMLANNVHPKIVQERLGHSDISMTLNRYSHVTMDMQRQAADVLDAAMGGAS